MPYKDPTSPEAEASRKRRNEKQRIKKGVVTKSRAGNRRCRRCKKAFYKEAGDALIICPYCRGHCARCNVELNETNFRATNGTKKRYYCTPCDKEARLQALGNKGFNAREYRLLKTFAITIKEYEAILAAQEGVCWICQKPPSGNALAVDHRHVLRDKQQDPRDTRTRIRGLLCWQCNGAVGKFKDDPARLRRAAEYLETCPAQMILKESK